MREEEDIGFLEWDSFFCGVFKGGLGGLRAKNVFFGGDIGMERNLKFEFF